ncbi:MAG: hypothetical protein K1X79_13765 [Oligoflexia bacterium]|nr:hypothetical protein [Oligoflexia bacterium]
MQAVIAGVPLTTQTDGKTHWGDGSLQHAIISFVLPQLNPFQVLTVSFVEQASCNNTPLTRSQMLAGNFDFDARMTLTPASTGVPLPTTSAREALTNGNFTYWTQGPVNTTVIIADHSLNRLYDIGTDSYRAIRPIAVVSFWPAVNGGGAIVRFIGELANSEALEDQGPFNLSYSVGLTNPTQVFSQSNVTFRAMTRFTVSGKGTGGIDPNGPAPQVDIDHNIAYLIESRAIPNYDRSDPIPQSYVATAYQNFLSTPRLLTQQGPIAYKEMGAPGGAKERGGINNEYAVQYLLTGDWRLWQIVKTYGELAGAWPMNIRVNSSGRIFDAQNTPALGRVWNSYSHPRNRTFDGNSQLNMAGATDLVNFVGPRTDDGWIGDLAHQMDAFGTAYLLSGDYYFLEQLQFWTIGFNSHHLSWDPGWTTSRGWTVQDSTANDQPRADARYLINGVFAHILTPESSAPEKAYLQKILFDTIARWEGAREIQGTQFYNTPLYSYGYLVDGGRQNRGGSYGIFGVYGHHYLAPPSLHFWKGIDTPRPNEVTANTFRVEVMFQDWYLLTGLGWAKELGYPTGALLSYAGRFPIDLITQSGSPCTINLYYFPTTSMPIAPSTSYTWFPTFGSALQEVVAPKVANACVDLANGLGDRDGHSFAALAAGALSYLTQEPGGSAAWAWIDQAVWGQALARQNVTARRTRIRPH